MKKLLTVFLLFVSGWCVGQAPAIEWQKCYGGTGAESVSGLQKTSDGGFVTAGGSTSVDGDVSTNNGDRDYWIVKSDFEGTIQWQKSFGGPGSDSPSEIKQTLDGGYIVVGLTTANGGDVSGYHIGGWPGPNTYDGWVIKIDSVGNMDWQICLGGTGTESSNSVLQLTDSGYIVAGNVGSQNGNVSCPGHGGSDAWIIKLNTDGDIVWQKCMGGSADDWFQSIQQTYDGGFIAAGLSRSVDGDITNPHGGSDDYWVVKLDSLGNIEWQKCYGGYGGDVGHYVQQTSDGGYFVGGNTTSTDGDVTGLEGNLTDYWVLKLDSTGTIQWQKTLGGSNEEYSYSGIQTTDGGFLVSGASLSVDGDVSENHGGIDYWLAKLDSFGAMQWKKSLGGSGDDWAHEIIEINDDEYIVAGYTRSNDGDVADYNGGTDQWIVKLSGQVGTQEANGKNTSINLYPNPATTTLTIESTPDSYRDYSPQTIVAIYNTQGQLISHPLSRGECASLSAGKGCVIDISQFPTGLYYLTLQSNEGVATKKFEVIR